ncbi:MAG: hypothetical protein ACI4D6_01505 [Chordicoccus sp.]
MNEDIANTLVALEAETSVQMINRELPYLQFLENHADRFACTADAAFFASRWTLHTRICHQFHAAFQESGGWNVLTKSEALLPVSDMLGHFCRNPEDKGSTRTTYGQILSDILSGMRTDIARSAVRAMVESALADGSHPEWKEAQADLDVLLNTGNLAEHAWQVLAETERTRAVPVLDSPQKALAFAYCDDMPFSALMLEAEKQTNV